MTINEDRLKKLILDASLASTADIETAEAYGREKNMTLSDALLSLGKMSESDLARLHAYAFGVPFVSLIGEKIPFEILSMIPEPIARSQNIIAYKRCGDELEVAMLDIDDMTILDSIKKKVALKILPRLTDTASIKQALAQYRKSLQADFDAIIKKEGATIGKLDLQSESRDGDVSTKELAALAEDLPIVKIVDTLISHAILQGASDVHIEPTEDALIVRYRIDGILHDAMSLPKESAAGVVARIKVLSNLKLDEKRLPQDGRFKINNEGQNVSFRVSTLPTYFGEKTVFRILIENSKGYTLESLGFHGEALERIHHAMRQKTGMILATGPTGSGKTTTLYTMLDMLNTPEVNISTIEDPIEYQMPRINQSQVKPEIGFSFANGLRTLLRQDPDIVMVGEIRDEETASLAINASLTGHLVLSTIHTNSAAGAVPRMTDMGAEPFLIISTVKTVIGQRLVRRLADSKEKSVMTSAEIDALKKIIDTDRMLDMLKKENVVGPKATWQDLPIYRPKQSDEAPDGYKGRVGIHEVMTVTTTLKEMILKGASEDAIQEQAKKEGMMTMLEDGIYLAVQGETTIEEVLRVVSE